MRRKILLGLLTIALLVGALTVFASADTVSHECQACGKTVTWEPLNPKQGATLIAGHYHFYLSQSYTGDQTAQFILEANVKVCLDLHGKTFATNGRSLLAKSGSVFNVMDSVGGGAVNGSTAGNNPGSGTFAATNGGVFNLYSGTLRFTKKTGNYYGTGRGAVGSAESGGTINIYGGTVEGGEVVKSTYSGMAQSTTNGCGGAIYVYGGGNLNISGGKITSGIVPEGGRGPCVYLEGATSKLTLSGNANVEHIYAEKTNGITVSGAYTGKARIFYGSGVTPANQLKIGTASNADLSGADLMCINGSGWKPVVSGTELKLATFTPTGAYHWCTHCKDYVNWTPMASNLEKIQTAGNYHIYLPRKYETAGQLIPENNAQICLDLYGQTFESSRRAIHVTKGTVNLMDSVGGGRVIGHTGTNNPDAGASAVKAGSVMNMYGGTLEFIKVNTAYGTGRGGAMFLEGTLNMFGGTIQGGDMVVSTYYNLAYNGCGGAIYMIGNSTLNMYGGKILSGSVPEGKYGPCIFVEKNTSKINLSGDAQVEDIFFVAASADNFKITGDYTGSVALNYLPTIAPDETTVLGSCDGWDVSGATIICGTKEVLAREGKLYCSTFGLDTVAGIYTDTEAVGYESLEEALEAYTEGVIQLCKPVSENVTVDGVVYLDMNGYSINGTVTVTGTLYGMDSQTDDYDVTDGVYGRLTAVTQGSGKVLGWPADDDQDNYLMLNEGGKLSFHRVTLQLSGIALRPQVAGLYYTSRFLADQKAAAAITTFGVALSVEGAPTAENMENYTAFENFQGGPAGNGDRAGTLLTGILKEENTQLENLRNLHMPVYGVAYVRTAEDCLLGMPVCYNLAAIMEEVDALVDSLNSKTTYSLVDMCEKFDDVIHSENYVNLHKEVEKQSGEYLRILMVGNSHGLDATQMLNEVFKAEAPGKKVLIGRLYYSGCTMPMHAQHASGNEKVYEYSKIDTTSSSSAWNLTKNCSILDALEDETWDIVVMQQQNEQNGIASSWNATAFQTVINHIYENQAQKPKLLWQMLWVNPDDYTRYIGTNAPLAHPSPDWYQTYYETNFPGADGKYDHEVLYNKIVTQTQQKLVDSNDFLGQAYFDGIIPAATTVEYAVDVLGRPQYEMFRDWTHLSDYGRVMVAYQWYAEIMGLESISQVNMSTIPSVLHQTKSTYPADLKLTDEMKQDIIRSVNWTLDNPFELPEKKAEAPSYSAYFAADPGADDTYRVLMIGNSGCYYYADELYAMLDGAGIKAEVWNVYYSGCNVKQHWTWLNTDAANYRLVRHDQSGRTAIDGLTMEQCLLTANWDVITLQQAFWPEQTVETAANATLSYAKYLTEYVRQRFPKADLKWHQTWAYQVGFSPLTEDPANVAAIRKVLSVEKQTAFYQVIKNTCDTVCRENGLDYIPVANAWQLARQNPVVGDNLCARLGSNNDKGDNLHDGDIGGGQYLNACVWFETLTGKSCVGNTFRPSYELSEEKIAALQAAAHQAVEEKPAVPNDSAFFAEDPGEDDTFRVLMVGNSSCYYYADELYAMLAGAGIKAEVWNVYYSGCNVKQHWTWLNNNTANYRLIRHDSQGRSAVENMTLQQCLLVENWDVVTLQQAVFPQMCYDTQATLDATMPYANDLIAYFREKLPKADMLWHQTWAFEIGFYPLAGDKENSPDTYKVLDIEKRNLYYQMICTVTDAVCQENDLPVIPTGDAWEIARKSDLIGTTLCARLGVRDDKGDYGHDGDIGGGQYLNACVWYEILTGNSCVGNTFRPSYELSEEKIAVLQAAAHQAVAELKAK